MSVEPGKGIRTPGIDGDEEIVIHDARAAGAEDDFDRSLRPPKLEDFVNQLQVTDGGADGIVQTTDNTLFAVQGIFIP